ncbi:MAG: hypothetical protein RIE82_18540, partial [Roseovarius sp.]
GTAVIRMEEAVGTASRWDIEANSAAFVIQDALAGTIPVAIEKGSPSYAIRVLNSGNVGFGTNSPQAPLELFRREPFTFLRLTAAGATINDSVDIVFTEGPLGTGELRYNIVDGDGPEMRLNADGDMVLSGTLTTAGPTCAAGCDAVFEPDYDRLSIAEHASEMWAKGYLPAVGPTTPGAPLNVAEKLGAVLNELEHAHIYIEQVHEDLVDQQARLDRQDRLISSLLQRLEKVEQM